MPAAQRSRRRPRPAITLVAAAACAVLAGCALGPDFKPPAAPTVQRYSVTADPVQTVAAQGVAQTFTPGAEVTGDWWRLFQSPALDALVQQALAANPGLAAARASLRQSEDNLRGGYGVFLPAVGLSADGSRQRRAALPAESVPAGLYSLFTLSASVSYALDVFGGERRLVEQLGAEVDVQRQTSRGTYLTLEADVVNAAIARAAYLAQIDATRELIRVAGEQVQLAQVRVQAGSDPYSEVLSLQSQLAQFQAGIPALQQKVTQSEDLLATLAGKLPAQWLPPQLSLQELKLPPQLPVTLPSQLVRQRPDILAAEATLHAAGANVGVATAAMFPTLTLSGAYGAGANATGQLFTAASRQWSAGAGLTQPLFQGGTLWYRRRAALEAWQQTQDQYRQTVLSAFAQVADVLGALDHDAATLAAEDAALQAARDALHLVQVNYEAGRATYLDVLNADAQYQQAVVGDIQAVAQRSQDTVALYVALGGNWAQPDALQAP